MPKGGQMAPQMPMMQRQNMMPAQQNPAMKAPPQMGASPNMVQEILEKIASGSPDFNRFTDPKPRNMPFNRTPY